MNETEKRPETESPASGAPSGPPPSDDPKTPSDDAPSGPPSDS